MYSNQHLRHIEGTVQESNYTQNISLHLYRALIEIAKQYNRRAQTLEFAQKVFASLNHEKMSMNQVKETYTKIEENLDFFQVQKLRVNLLFFLHQEPRGNAIPGVSYRTILEKMIEYNITDNREFLNKGSQLLEKISSVSAYHERLKEIVSAFIFGHNLPEESVKIPTRMELYKQLQECHRKLKKFSQ